jgi:hypothetical protein
MIHTGETGGHGSPRWTQPYAVGRAGCQSAPDTAFRITVPATPGYESNRPDLGDKLADGVLRVAEEHGGFRVVEEFVLDPGKP